MEPKTINLLMIATLCAVFSSAVAIDGDPNAPAGIVYTTSGTTQDMGGCPSWNEVFRRNSTDAYKQGQIIIELDGCLAILYEIISIQQEASSNLVHNLTTNDIFVVWDEDPGHGSTIDFSFTNNNYVDVTNDDTDHVKVSSTNDSIINWRIYKVTAPGTLTVHSTGYNEHDIIRVQYNYLNFQKSYYLNGDPDNTGCAVPGDEITYQICWHNTSQTTFEDTYIVDYLPYQVNYEDWLISIAPLVIDPNYNMDYNSYTWLIGDIVPDSSGCLSIIATVNSTAEPGMNIHNFAEMYEYYEYVDPNFGPGDPNYILARISVNTPVCCYGDDPNMIYVDINAKGGNSGVSWADAYSGENGLQKALARAAAGSCGNPYKIYVAEGSYTPGNYAEDTHNIPEGVQVYGGFKTGGSIFNERNPNVYETVLTGYTWIDPDPNATTNYELNNTVVTMVDDPDLDETTLLDGFVITDAVNYGIFGVNVDFDVVNCKVMNSEILDGISAENCDVTIGWSKITNNGRDGIGHEGPENTVAVHNCQTINNERHGIFSRYSTPIIKNSVILGNGYYDSFYFFYEGIKIDFPTETPVLYNNTFIHNALAGITWDDDRTISDPNTKDYPDIQNCIFWKNNYYGNEQVTGFDEDTYISYSCIQGCNEVNNNINDDPNFVLKFDTYDSPDEVHPFYYHLIYNSPCKDMGNPVHNTNDVGLDDIDAEDRIYGSYVDIGADEIYSCDGILDEEDIFERSLDWNVDAIVNYHEFAEISAVWLIRDPNDPAIITDPNYSSNPNYADPATLAKWLAKWDARYNFDDSGSSEYWIDIDDLRIFAVEWLSVPCWRQSLYDRFNSLAWPMGGEEMMMMGMGMEIPLSEPEPEPQKRPASELYNLAEGIYAIIETVDVEIVENPPNVDALYDMKAFLEDVLLDLQAEHQK